MHNQFPTKNNSTSTNIPAGEIQLQQQSTISLKRGQSFRFQNEAKDVVFLVSDTLADIRRKKKSQFSQKEPSLRPRDCRV